MDRAAFIAWMVSRHDGLDPEWAAEGWSTLVAGDLARSVQRSIDAGDREAVVHAFETVRLAWRDGDDGVRNDVVVSCLRRLDLTDGRARRAWARDLLPPVLQVALASYEARSG